MQYSEHFTVDELQCPTTKKIILQPGFIEELEELRLAYGRPMNGESGCRSTQHNRWLISRGYRASPNSFHLYANPKYGTDTCAIDIRRPAGPDLHKLISIATAKGWTVGVAGSFIHLDLRARYTDLSPTIYTYR